MRAVVDTNVLISYLLNPTSDSAPARIVHAVFAGRFTLLVSDMLTNELMRTLRNKPYLNARIPGDKLQAFVKRLRGISTLIPDITRPIPRVSRDPNDDFLIAHVIKEHADCLVSGDPDLLVLGEFEGVRIVSPAAFMHILDSGNDTGQMSVE